MSYYGFPAFDGGDLDESKVWNGTIGNGTATHRVHPLSKRTLCGKVPTHVIAGDVTTCIRCRKEKQPKF